MPALSRSAPPLDLAPLGVQGGAKTNGCARLIFDFFRVWKSKACGKPGFLQIEKEGNQNPMSSAAVNETAPAAMRLAGRPFDKCPLWKSKTPRSCSVFVFGKPKISKPANGGTEHRLRSSFTTCGLCIIKLRAQAPKQSAALRPDEKAESDLVPFIITVTRLGGRAAVTLAVFFQAGAPNSRLPCILRRRIRATDKRPGPSRCLIRRRRFS